MTSHMLEFVRSVAWYARIEGPVLEIGSRAEVSQEHLDLRTAFPPRTTYVGVDSVPGPGVDRVVDLLDGEAMEAIADEVRPRTVLCLYVLEHVFEIRRAADALAAMWKKNPESWLWVATHQNQPYHGTDVYGDFWRVTAEGMRRLFEAAGLPDPRVFVIPDTSNPADVVMIRQPLSESWPGEAMTKTVERLRTYAAPSSHWEQYC